jgi:hypothetical protein
LDNIDPAGELFYPIQTLANLIFLTKHDLQDKEKVLLYMNMAEAELARLTDVAQKLGMLTGLRPPVFEN